MCTVRTLPCSALHCSFSIFLVKINGILVSLRHSVLDYCCLQKFLQLFGPSELLSQRGVGQACHMYVTGRVEETYD